MRVRRSPSRDWTSPIPPPAVNHLLERSLVAPVTGYTVGHGTSDNASKRLSLAQTRDVLGYAPQDDAFAGR